MKPHQISNHQVSTIYQPCTIYIYRLIFILVSSLTAQTTAIGQLQNLSLHNYADTARTGLTGSFQHLSYFKNNEYFNTSYPGETLLGAQSMAALTYKKNMHYFTGGVMLANQYSQPFRFKWYPILSLRYFLNQSHIVTLGVLEGGKSHELPTEIYGGEHMLAYPLEYGVQLQYKKEWGRFETWLDWRQNIVAGDSVQEKFTQGTTAKVFPIHTDHNKVTIQAGLLFYHAGGQVLSVSLPVITLTNWFGKLELRHRFDNDLSLGINYTLSGFKNAPDNPNILWKNGVAHHFQLQSAYDTWSIHGGYYNSKDFVAPHGEYIFALYNFDTNSYRSDSRKLIYSGLGYLSHFDRNFSISAGVDFFYDLQVKKIEYNYTLTGKFQLN